MNLKIATLNCENLFSRPKIFYAQDSTGLLDAVNKLNEALKQAVFDHQLIAGLLDQLKGYAYIVDVRGKHTSAQGAADWMGWVELSRTRNTDIAIYNTARVIAEIDADIQCLCEVENRPVLCAFHDQLLWPNFLKQAGKRPFPYILVIDGNDDRGIDVAVMSRFPIISLQTHIYEKTIYQGKETKLFSRDCLEVGVEVQPGVRLVVMVNHFKSMGYNPPGDPNSDQRRLQQARRVAEIAGAYPLDQVYLAIVGDLNSPPTNMSLAPLVNHPSLYNVNLELPPAERGTYRTGTQQLDYLFISSALHQYLSEVYIERRGAFAKAKWQPFNTVTSHATAASDHCAVIASFQL
jgi:endonuclease/exonuclease/phosphatase family metal-dependent hydrolase